MISYRRIHTDLTYSAVWYPIEQQFRSPIRLKSALPLYAAITSFARKNANQNARSRKVPFVVAKGPRSDFSTRFYKPDTI